MECSYQEKHERFASKRFLKDVKDQIDEVLQLIGSHLFSPFLSRGRNDSLNVLPTTAYRSHKNDRAYRDVGGVDSYCDRDDNNPSSSVRDYPGPQNASLSFLAN